MTGSVVRAVLAVVVGTSLFAASGEVIAKTSGGATGKSAAFVAKPAHKPAVRKPNPSQAVMVIQRALNAQGAKLKVDGRMGPKTRTALKQYQARNGLSTSGRLDRATRVKLGI